MSTTPVRSEMVLGPRIEGPAGAPFRPGDRFRWTSGNGLTVRTGTILEWQPYVAGSVLAAKRWGSWYVDVEPLPKPRGVRARKHNPWDGFRTWFTGDEMGLVERVTP